MGKGKIFSGCENMESQNYPQALERSKRKQFATTTNIATNELQTLHQEKRAKITLVDSDSTTIKQDIECMVCGIVCSDA